MIVKDKVVLVTGAGRGFGWGIAQAFGREGARVCVTDINDTELERSYTDLKNIGCESLLYHLDASDYDNFHVVVNEVHKKWGRLDAVVHNGIYMPLILFEDMDQATWWRQLQVSLGGFFNATKAAWNIMKAQGGGHIIGVASGSSFRGFKHETGYCTGKHGQEGLVKALSLESAPYKISFNTIGPGKPIKTTDITWEQLDKLSPQAKTEWADPADLGKAFVWLVHQPPGRFSGFRFDAGPIADTVNKEGYDFAFDPKKVTLYVDDFLYRKQWYENYKD